MTTLLLVRHGQTLWNSELRYQGQLDTELSPFGLAQATCLAARLRDEPIAAVYTSDLRRCLSTAETLAAPHCLPPVLLPALREAHYGDWQGLTYAEVRARFPEMVAARRHDAIGFTPPAGESLGATHARVLAAINAVAAKHPAATVLVVTHGGPLRMLVAGLLGVSPSHIFRLRVDNCGLTVCEAFPKSPVFVSVNDICHLRGLGPPADPALGN